MADELSNVQASQGTNPLWPIGGAVVGGGATYYGLNRAGYSSSPYKSVEDLIKEKEDTFNGKKVNNDVQQKAADKAKSSIETAAAKYDADFEAYKAKPENANVLKETPEYKALVEKQNAAEKALEEKRAAEAEKLKGKKVSGNFDYNRLPEYINEATQKRERDFKAKVETFINQKEELLNKVQDAKNSNNKSLENSLNKEIEALDKEINNYLDKEITSWHVSNGKKVKGDAVKNAIKAAKENTLYNIQSAIDERVLNTAEKSNFGAKYTKILEDFKSAAGQKYGDAVDKIVGKKDQFESIKSLANRKITANNKVMDQLVEIQLKLEESLKKGSEPQAEQVVKQLKVLFGLLEKKETIVPGEKAVTPFIETLSKEEQNLVTKILGDKKISSEELQKIIDGIDGQNKKLLQVITNVDSYKADVEKIAGKGAFVKDGKLFDAKGNEVTIGDSSRFLGRKKVTIPECRKADIIAELKANGSAEMTEEQIKAEVDRILSSDIKQVEEGAQRVKVAREGLEKGAAKTPEQIKEEFTKLNGTKREAITKALKESEGELKPLFEKKWGNGKVAAAIAGGAAVLGLLSYLVAPNKKA